MESIDIATIREATALARAASGSQLIGAKLIHNSHPEYFAQRLCGVAGIEKTAAKKVSEFYGIPVSLSKLVPPGEAWLVSKDGRLLKRFVV